MPHLDPADLTKLLARPHTAKATADFIVPEAVLTGDMPVGYNERGIQQVEYTNGVGTPADVLDGMPVYVYDSSDNLQGVVRAKSADATYIYIAENDEILFLEGSRFEILKIFLIWPKFHIADVSGSNPVFYKDYDVAYTDQNENPPPVPILGPHVRIKYLNGASVNVNWDAGDSYGVHSGVTITGYSWVFEGGSPGTSANSSETVTYSVAGQYLTTLTITDSNGETATAYRWVIVRDTVADSQAFVHDALLKGEYSKGGWTVSLRTQAGPTIADLPDGSPVAVHVNGKAGGTVLDFGGFDDCEDLYFCGWLQKDTVDVDPGTYQVAFSAATADYIMSTIFNFDTFVYDVDTAPASWLEIQGLDVRKAGNHLLRWHSNVLELIDVHLPDDSVRTAGIDAPEGKLFDQLKNMFQRVRYLVTGCNSQGALYIQRDVQHMTWAQRSTYDYNHIMAKAHYKAGVSWPRQHFNRQAMLELQAVSWNGSDPTALFSRAPGTVPTCQGQVKEVTGLAVDDQDECNTLAGMFYSALNNFQTGVGFSMAGNWFPALDVFPQAIVGLPVGLTIRGWEADSTSGVVRSIEFHISENGAPQTKWTLDVLVNEKDGLTFEYPDPADLPIVDPPSPPPDLPPPLPPPPEPGGAGRVHIATSNAGVWVTEDITEAYPTWTSVNTGLSGSGLNVIWMARDPVSPQYRMYLVTGNGVYLNTNIQTPASWTSQLTPAQAEALCEPGSTMVFTHLKPQISAPGRIWTRVQATYTYPNSYLIHSDDYGVTWPYSDKAFHWCGGSWPDLVGCTQLIPSPHNPYHVWIFGTGQTSVWKQTALWRTRQGNMQKATSLARVQNTGYPYYSGGGGHIPWADNDDEKRGYLYAWYSGSANHTYRVDDGYWAGGTGPDETCDPLYYTALTDITPTFAAPGFKPSLFGSYTEDKDRIWFIDDYGVCGLSNNAGNTWMQKASVGFGCHCASGFPTNSSLFFAGIYDGGSIHDSTLIKVSDDGGDSWSDRSGDLYDGICALLGGYPKVNIVTIAPEF